jgi:hypothetical protein
MTAVALFGIIAIVYAICILAPIRGRIKPRNSEDAMKEDTVHPIIERGPAGPIVALFCLLVGLMVGSMTYGLFCWKPETPSQRVVQIFASECFATFTLFAVLGFIWSLFAPRWLERLIQTLITKLMFAIGVLLFVGVCLFIYFSR